MEKAPPRNPAKLTGKTPAPKSLLQQSRRPKASNFIKKETPAQASSRESRETPESIPLQHTSGGCLRKDVGKKAYDPITIVK